MKQKTILVVAPYFPPDGGGLEKYAYEISCRLRKDHSWRVAVVTSGERCGKDAKEEKDGMTVYRLSYHWKFSNTPFAAGWLWKVRRILKAENPDVVNIHTPVPGLGDIAAFLARKKPLIVTYHAGSMRKGRLFPDAFVWLYEHGPLKCLLRRADRIICSSDWVRFGFLRRYAYKSMTITPAADCQVFTPAPQAAARKKNPEILFVAGLGRSERYKGLAMLMDAVSALRTAFPGVRLSVVGDGDMKGEYEQYARQLGLHGVVRFAGRLAGLALAEAYRQADIFALPTSNDSYPTVVIEAMASGVPVVSTNAGSIPSIVADGVTGFLIEPEDRQALVKKLGELLSDPDRAAAFGAAGREKAVKEFDWNVRADDYQHILQERFPAPSQKRLRILETPIRFHPYIGGVENHVYYLADQLIKLGHAVEVICANEPESDKVAAVNGVNVKRLDYLFKIANTNIALNFPYAVWKADFDIAHTHMPTPWTADWTVLIAALRGKSSVITVHNDMDKPDFFGKIMTWIYLHTVFLLTLYLADRVIIVNPNWKTAFKKTRHIFERIGDKVTAIPNGINTDLFLPPAKKSERNVILFVSILDEHHRFKGFDYLLEAMPVIKERVDDVKLIVVGEGELVNEYREYAKKLGIEDSIEFYGKKTQAEIVKYYQDAKVFVLPSIEIEGFGIVLLEAMASGLPVVTTSVAGVALEIKENQAGIVIKPRDAAALADALIRILGSKAMQEAMGSQGRSLTIRQYGWHTVAESVLKVFKEISS